MQEINEQSPMMELEERIKEVKKMKAAEQKAFQLTKNSDNELIKTYFTKVLELKNSGKEFPINFDEVWRLVYSRKDKALDVLKSEFIENEDFIIVKSQSVENQRLRQNGGIVENQEDRKIGGNLREKDYFLSVPCLEYFIAKRVKSVFEVYRRVFHKVLENEKEVKSIPPTRRSIFAFNIKGLTTSLIPIMYKDINKIDKYLVRDRLFDDLEFYTKELFYLIDDLVKDIYKIEDKELRLSIASKIIGN